MLRDLVLKSLTLRANLLEATADDDHCLDTDVDALANDRRHSLCRSHDNDELRDSGALIQSRISRHTHDRLASRVDRVHLTLESGLADDIGADDTANASLLCCTDDSNRLRREECANAFHLGLNDNQSSNDSEQQKTH